MDITITIPDNMVTRVIDGVAGQNNYQETVQDDDGYEIPNPETKGQFVKRMVRQYLKENVKAWEANQAASSARIAAIAAVEADIQLS